MMCSNCHSPIYSVTVGCVSCRIWDADSSELQRKTSFAASHRAYREVSFAPPEPMWAPTLSVAALDTDEDDDAEVEHTRISLRRMTTRFWAIDFPDGTCEVVVGNVVVGRAPTVDPQWLPGRALRVADAPGSLSKSHAMFTEDHGALVVRDLFSCNGTVVCQPGQPEIELMGGESLVIANDTVVELGDTMLTLRRH